jgi:geranylgeranyl diphosphate synthase type II
MEAIKPFAKYFESEIGNYSFPLCPSNLYDPLTYFLQLGGKRIRPLLTLMAANMFGESESNAIHASLAIEFFHNFSLIHDDIMDKAPLRRGKATVHKKWNDDIAILSGDVLLIKAYQELSKQENIHVPLLLDVFNRTAVEVCEGQQLDMDFESRVEVSIDEYIEMIRLKTSVLLGCALEFGAIVSNASKKDRELIYEFGQNLGIAFQIQDDILDLFGDPEKFGKQIGGDVISNKKTILLLKAKELDVQEVLKMMQLSNSETKINVAKSIFTSLGVVDFARQKMKDYQDKALKSLSEISVKPSNKTTLIELSEYLFQRDV